MKKLQILKLRFRLFYVQKRQVLADYLIKHSLGVSYATMLFTLVVIPLTLSLIFAFALHLSGSRLFSTAMGTYFDFFIITFLSFIFIEYVIMSQFNWHMKPSEIEALFAAYTGSNIELKIHDLQIVLGKTILENGVVSPPIPQPITSQLHNLHKYTNKI